MVSALPLAYESQTHLCPINVALRYTHTSSSVPEHSIPIDHLSVTALNSETVETRPTSSGFLLPALGTRSTSVIAAYKNPPIMFNNELKAREKKLLSEQSHHVERVRQRLEKERLVQERQRQREKDREDEKTRKRLEEEQAARKAAERMEQLIEHNCGVYFSAMLHAVPTDEASVAARGIKRSEDRLLLPRSVGAALMAQDAPRNGAMMFEVATPGGCITHAGLLEFAAAEGVVGIPRKVADCLWGRGATAAGPVTVTYKRLDKGTFVRFQPLTRGFHDAVEDNVREVLERALMQCTALTEGDIVRVECTLPEAPAGASPSGLFAEAMQLDSAPAASVPVYDFLVQELLPSSCVSLIDTDIEAQVVPSLETEQALKQLEEHRQALEEQRQARERQALEVLKQAQDEVQRRQALEEQHRLDEAQLRERQRQALEDTLPPEPPAAVGEAEAAGCSGTGTAVAAAQTTSVVFRMPDGSRAARRFLLTDPVGMLFHFCDAKGAGGFRPGSYRLVMQYPRRVLEQQQQQQREVQTLAQAGLCAGQQEAVMLEAMQPAGAPVEGRGGEGVTSGAVRRLDGGDATSL